MWVVLIEAIFIPLIASRKGFGHRWAPKSQGVMIKFTLNYLRICLGRHVSNDSIFIDIVSLLWTAKLSPIKDGSGKIMTPDPFKSVNTGMVVCVFPRSLFNMTRCWHPEKTSRTVRMLYHSSFPGSGGNSCANKGIESVSLQKTVLRKRPVAQGDSPGAISITIQLNHQDDKKLKW